MVSSSKVSSIRRSRFRIAGVLLFVTISLGAIGVTSTSPMFSFQETSPSNTLEENNEDPVNSIVPLPRIEVYTDIPLPPEVIDGTVFPQP